MSGLSTLNNTPPIMLQRPATIQPVFIGNIKPIIKKHVNKNDATIYDVNEQENYIKNNAIYQQQQQQQHRLINIKSTIEQENLIYNSKIQPNTHTHDPTAIEDDDGEVISPKNIQTNIMPQMHARNTNDILENLKLPIKTNDIINITNSVILTKCPKKSPENSHNGDVNALKRRHDDIDISVISIKAKNSQQDASSPSSRNKRSQSFAYETIQQFNDLKNLTANSTNRRFSTTSIYNNRQLLNVDDANQLKHILFAQKNKQNNNEYIVPDDEDVSNNAPQAIIEEKSDTNDYDDDADDDDDDDIGNLVIEEDDDEMLNNSKDMIILTDEEIDDDIDDNIQELTTSPQSSSPITETTVTIAMDTSYNNVIDDVNLIIEQDVELSHDEDENTKILSLSPSTTAVNDQLKLKLLAADNLLELSKIFKKSNITTVDNINNDVDVDIDEPPKKKLRKNENRLKTYNNLNIIKVADIDLTSDNDDLICEEEILNRSVTPPQLTSSPKSITSPITQTTISTNRNNLNIKLLTATATAAPSPTTKTSPISLIDIKKLTKLNNIDAVIPANITDVNINNIVNELEPPSSELASIIAPSLPLPSLDGTKKFTTVLNVLSTYSMISWHHRVGSTPQSKLRYKLNDFNLLQIYEPDNRSYRVHTAFEKPIKSRATCKIDQKVNQPQYKCIVCRSIGRAEDFLAPKFCSHFCLKSACRKRRSLITNAKNQLRKIPTKKTQIVLAQTTNVKHKKNLMNAKIFDWSTYLNENPSFITAPINLFKNPFPTERNHFERNMKVEAIDPDNGSLFCVCTVVEILGYRIRLHIDGYDNMYDFWVNADSQNIFPPGFCARTNRILQPPKGIPPKKFDWKTYLDKHNARAAPRNLFNHIFPIKSSLASATDNLFQIGMHLEAEDLNDTGKLCVATVSDKIKERIRVHFDGWDECYDYWISIRSPYIHPCGWHEGRQQLIVPPEYENCSFNWNDYIKHVKAGEAISGAMLLPRKPNAFEVNMKVEVVDPKMPAFIRPATIIQQKGHRLKLHLDGWSDEYTFWIEDDSLDLHPIGWCDATGYVLEPPNGYKLRTIKAYCITDGCRGIGNWKIPHLDSHSQSNNCPYSIENWNKKLLKPVRIESQHILRHEALKTHHKRQMPKLLPKPQQKLINLKTNVGEAKANNDDECIVISEDEDEVEKIVTQNSNTSNTSILINPTIKLPIISVVKNVDDEEIDDNAIDPSANCVLKDEDDNIKLLPPPPPPPQPAAAAASTSAEKKENDIEEDNSLIADLIEAKEDYTINRRDALKLILEFEAIHGKLFDENTNYDAKDLAACLQICNSFLKDYGPRLLQNYNVWRQNFTFDTQYIRRNPLEWSTKKTCSFIDFLLNCDKTVNSFRVRDIDGQALLSLEVKDLTYRLGMKLGPASKLYSHILQLRCLAYGKYLADENAEKIE